MHVGVDVERVDNELPNLELADRYFSAVEAEGLRRCEAHQRAGRFCDLWTLKEAFLKAAGMGLAEALSLTTFEFGADGSVRFASRVHLESWHFALFAPSPWTRLAVAVHDNGLEAPRVIIRPAGHEDTEPLGRAFFGPTQQMHYERHL